VAYQKLLVTAIFIETVALITLLPLLAIEEILAKKYLNLSIRGLSIPVPRRGEVCHAFCHKNLNLSSYRKLFKPLFPLFPWGEKDG
jgi:hypothetical protein